MWGHFHKGTGPNLFNFWKMRIILLKEFCSAAALWKQWRNKSLAVHLEGQHFAKHRILGKNEMILTLAGSIYTENFENFSFFSEEPHLEGPICFVTHFLGVFSLLTDFLSQSRFRIHILTFSNFSKLSVPRKWVIG